MLSLSGEICILKRFPDLKLSNLKELFSHYGPCIKWNWQKKHKLPVVRNKFPEIVEPIKEDICYATTNRQAAVKKIAKECEMFFIIGSRNSSNSLRLVEVAQQAGCKQSELIISESKVPIEKIINCSTIGISSGASAPEVLVKNFINQIKQEVDVDIKEVEIIKENIVFKTPGKLN